MHVERNEDNISHDFNLTDSEEVPPKEEISYQL